ncbi:hypothetical protein AB0D10_37575, partial [Kitasatospora sp. NPDC048545]|uniref:hypothetical protein n=1 Tax=Kitasatospora sp. NPDC048545 TaxID=3157208 RepID=UPI0034086929
AIDSPDEMSPNAPRIITIKVAGLGAGRRRLSGSCTKTATRSGRSETGRTETGSTLGFEGRNRGPTPGFGRSDGIRAHLRKNAPPFWHKARYGLG